MVRLTKPPEATLSTSLFRGFRTAVQSTSLCLTRTQLRHERDLADEAATSVSGLMAPGNGIPYKNPTASTFRVPTKDMPVMRVNALREC